jgi:glycosyltransferase involved in cell wall biosynthesis
MELRMHVLMVLPWYKPEIGGVVHGVSQLAKRLTARGVKVTILVQQPYKTPTRVGSDGDIEVYAFNTRVPVVDGHNFKSFSAFIWYLWPTVRKLRRFLRERQVDLVNVHYPSGQYLYFGLLRRLFGYPLVVAVHGSDIRFQYDAGGLNQCAYKHLLKMSDAVAAVSEDLLEQARQRVSLEHKLTTIMFSGADPEFFSAQGESMSPTQPPYILCVARLHPIKGHDTLLRAFEIVKRTDQSGCQLYLAGGGECEADLRKQIEELGLTGSVRLLGSVNRAELVRLNSAALFAVLASRSEGLPLTIIEAFAAGKTTVATDVGGTKEVVEDGVTGLLAPPDNPQALAEKIRWLLEHPEDRTKMARNARAKVEQRFTWDNNADSYAALFSRLLAGRK